MVWTQEVSFVVKENSRFCTVWSYLHVSSQPACYTHVFWLRKAGAELPHGTDGIEHFSASCFLRLMRVKQNMCPFLDAADQFIALMYSPSNDAWKQDKAAWALFTYLYFWFYSSKLLITSKAAGFKTMPSIIPLHFRKQDGRKQWLPNIFNLSGIILNPCCELECSCFHSELDTGWTGACVDSPYGGNLQPSPKCLWSSKRFSAHFFLT